MAMEMAYSMAMASNKPSVTPPLTPTPSISSVENRRPGGCCTRRPNSNKYQSPRPSTADQEEVNDLQTRFFPAHNRDSHSRDQTRTSLNAICRTPPPQYQQHQQPTTSSNNKTNNSSTITTAIVSIPTSSGPSHKDQEVYVHQAGHNSSDNPDVVRISTL